MGEFRVIFVANDYDATVGFFSEVMGLEVERSFGEIFRGTILLAAAGRIEVIEDGGRMGTRPGWRAYRCRGRSPTPTPSTPGSSPRAPVIVRPPELQPWGHKSLEVAGPDGLRIILFEVATAQ